MRHVAVLYVLTVQYRTVVEKCVLLSAVLSTSCLVKTKENGIGKGGKKSVLPVRDKFRLGFLPNRVERVVSRFKPLCP